jgi:type I restriction enzyme S subunit
MNEAKIPVGYKQTEIGLIPEDWDVLPLGDVVEINSGESPSKFKFISEGVPYFKVEQLNNDPVYADETEYRIKTNKIIKANSIIFPKRGASILLNKIRILKKDSYMDTNLMTLTCNEILDSYYLFKILSYKGLDTVADTTSIPQINNKHILPFLIPIPIFNEQTAIANALSDVDGLIAELDKLIAKKQAIKTATMQQLLTGKTRLPQFAHHPDGTKKAQKQTELGAIPEDWEVLKLGDQASFIGSGKTNTKQSGDYPLYGSTGVIGNCVVPEYVGEAILVARVGANAGSLNYVNGQYGVSDNTIIIKLKSECIVQYFRYLLIRKKLNTLVFGSGQPLITGTQLKMLLLPLPCKQEQTAIAQILSDMDTEIQTLQTRLSKTQQIKQGMMQQLLTGKVRLV